MEMHKSRGSAVKWVDRGQYRYIEKKYIKCKVSGVVAVDRGVAPVSQLSVQALPSVRLLLLSTTLSGPQQILNEKLHNINFTINCNMYSRTHCTTVKFKSQSSPLQ